MTPRTRSTGFTLIEMMVAMGVTLVVIAGAVVAMRSQQRAYYGGQRLREAQDAGRRAALALEDKLRHAGLGIDPALAFDFSLYGVREPLASAALCPSSMNGCLRDTTANADEIVFYYRNPAYVTADPDPVGEAWAMTTASTSTVTLRSKPGDVFPKGQILVAICRDPNKYAYFTVAQKYQNTLPAGSPAADTTLTLEPVDNQDPFRRQDVADQAPATHDVCFQSAYVYKVDRYRFHVRPVQVDATHVEPYLVLDMGIDRDLNDVVDADDEILVARGVELIQFAYVFSNGQTAGATPGAPIQFAWAQPGNPPAVPPTFGDQQANTITRTVFPLLAPTLDRSIYFPSSWFPVSQGAPERLLNAQGNIREIRVEIVARSQSADPERGSNLIVGPGFTLLNFQGSTSAPAWLTAGRPADGDDRFVRARLDFTIPLPNLNIRAMSL